MPSIFITISLEMMVWRFSRHHIGFLKYRHRNLWSMLFIVIGFDKIVTAFLEATLFSAQLQCHLSFSCIELQMLIRCRLMHISIIILRQVLYLVYLRPCRDLGLFMLYLCDLFFFFVLIFIMINCIMSWMQMHLLSSSYFRVCSIVFAW